MGPSISHSLPPWLSVTALSHHPCPAWEHGGRFGLWPLCLLFSSGHIWPPAESLTPSAISHSWTMAVPSLAVEPRGSPRKELVPGLHSPRDAIAHRQLWWGWGGLSSALHIPTPIPQFLFTHSPQPSPTHSPQPSPLPAHSPQPTPTLPTALVDPEISLLSFREPRGHGQT